MSFAARCSTPFAFAALLAGLAAPLLAEHAEPKVELSVSYFEPSFDTTVRLDGATLGRGTELHLEDDLGVESSAQEIRGDLSLRLGQRFRLLFDHVEFDRTGRRMLGRTVQFGDTVYSASAELSSEAKSSHTGGALAFSFVKNPTAEVALSLGVSYLDVAASISGRAVTSGGGAPIEIEEKGKASGPVPLVGLHGAFWVYDRLRVRLDGRYIDIGSLFDKNKWSGSMSELGLSVDYFVLPWLGLGGGWSRTSIDADFDDGSNLGSIKYEFDGLRATATATF